jgi:hypothetical protein
LRRLRDLDNSFQLKKNKGLHRVGFEQVIEFLALGKSLCLSNSVISLSKPGMETCHKRHYLLAIKKIIISIVKQFYKIEIFPSPTTSLPVSLAPFKEMPAWGEEELNIQ